MARAETVPENLNVCILGRWLEPLLMAAYAPLLVQEAVSLCREEWEGFLMLPYPPASAEGVTPVTEGWLQG